MATCCHIEVPAITGVTAAGLLDLALAVGDQYFGAQESDPATRAYGLALAVDPVNVEALSRLGRLMLIAGRPGDAIEYFSRAYIAQPDAATAVNLALAHMKCGDTVQALYHCAAAHALRPGYAPAYVQQAAIYELTARYQDALDICNEGLKRNPGDAALTFGRGCLRLLLGDRGGWDDYEHRMQRADLAQRLDEYEEWCGEDLAGKHLLVAYEQGIGDRIMFGRALPWLIGRGAQITLFSGTSEAGLFAQSFPGIRVVTSNAELSAIEPDYWVSICSLGRYADRIPCDSYLRAPGNEYGYVPPKTGRLRVGLAWSGNKQHRHDTLRSIPFDLLRPILEVQGVDFYSLQQGESRAIGNLGSRRHDLADLADGLRHLDLVISVDSSPAHLAGALGIPTWCMIYTPTDWRWGIQGRGTPWYRSVELFRQAERQAERGAWEPVISEVARRLEDLVRTRKPDSSITLDSTGRDDPPPPRPASRTTRYGNMRYWPNDAFVGRAIELYAEYSESEAAMLRSLLSPGDVVVEAGANIGGLTLAMAEAVGLSGRILAFEPQPKYAGLLTDNRLENVTVFDVALGAERGWLDIEDIPLDRIHAPGWPGDEKIRVAMTTIDAVVTDRLNLIKIDVDGAELDILRGAEGSIERCRPIVYVEYDKPERYEALPAWLIDRGYRIYIHDAPLYNPQNFACNELNVFGSLISRMLLCIPIERKDLKFPNLPRMRT